MRLTDTDFHATFTPPMEELGPEARPPFDFWEYFDEIPGEDFGAYDCSAGVVTFVYRDAAGRFEHVLVNSDDGDVFMVLVLDLKQCSVLGHYLLDLPAKYGFARRKRVSEYLVDSVWVKVSGGIRLNRLSNLRGVRLEFVDICKRSFISLESEANNELNPKLSRRSRTKCQQTQA